jgi:retron-type reverse transcriptase
VPYGYDPTVKMEWEKWAIEWDIKGFFDNVNHQLLATLIKKKIGEQQFIDLYWKLVKAGYVEKGVKTKTKKRLSFRVPKVVAALAGRLVLAGYLPATPATTHRLVSPILSNIYLHEFDLFVENLISKYHSNAKDIKKTKKTKP